jgi:hypothetical protein
MGLFDVPCVRCGTKFKQDSSTNRNEPPFAGRVKNLGSMFGPLCCNKCWHESTAAGFDLTNKAEAKRWKKTDWSAVTPMPKDLAVLSHSTPGANPNTLATAEDEGFIETGSKFSSQWTESNRHTQMVFTERYYSSGWDTPLFLREFANFLSLHGQTENVGCLRRSQTKLEIWFGDDGWYCVELEGGGRFQDADGLTLKFGRKSAASTAVATGVAAVVLTGGIGLVVGGAIAATRKKMESNFWNWIDGWKPIIADADASSPKPQVTAVASADIPEQLKKLAELHECGILTAEEFKEKKTDLLSRM